MHKADMARFWSKVERAGDCWVWQGTITRGGYGRFWLYGRMLRAHRAAYYFTYGSLPDGLHICHRCDNPPCVRPSHLFVGTDRDNVLDMITKGRHGWLDKNRDERPGKLAAVLTGENALHVKLTWAIVRQARARYAAGEASGATLAREVGVVYSHMHRILRNEQWVDPGMVVPALPAFTICARCRTQFEPRRRSAKFCSARCRDAEMHRRMAERRRTPPPAAAPRTED